MGQQPWCIQESCCVYSQCVYVLLYIQPVCIQPKALHRSFKHYRCLQKGKNCAGSETIPTVVKQKEPPWYGKWRCCSRCPVPNSSILIYFSTLSSVPPRSGRQPVHHCVWRVSHKWRCRRGAVQNDLKLLGLWRPHSCARQCKRSVAR